MRVPEVRGPWFSLSNHFEQRKKAPLNTCSTWYADCCWICKAKQLQHCFRQGKGFSFDGRWLTHAAHFFFMTSGTRTASVQLSDSNNQYDISDMQNHQAGQYRCRIRKSQPQTLQHVFIDLIGWRTILLLAPSCSFGFCVVSL